MRDNVMPEFATGATLVVGGTGGIGSAICTALAVAGSDIALTYRTKAESAETVARAVRAAGREAQVLQVDLTDPASITKATNDAIKRFGFLHSVVYASGPSFEYQYISEISPLEWARIITADVNGCFNLVAATLPHLRERKGGSYLAIITAAVDRAPPRDILSAAPKAAIEMLIRGIAREEGRNGIRANCLGPGYIEAGLGLATIHGDTEDYVKKMVRAIPLQRAGKAEDVADVAVFLLSNMARYVTGVSIPVAGGLQLA